MTLEAVLVEPDTLRDMHHFFILELNLIGVDDHQFRIPISSGLP